MDQFCLVWNPEGNMPRHRHDDHQSAVTEAKRLAKANPDQEFFVLVAVSRVKMKDPVEVIDLVPEPIF